MAAIDTARLTSSIGTEKNAVYSAADGRRFGLTVGSAFVALSAILYWRHSETAATIFAVLASLLYIAAFAAPMHLRGVEQAWMRLAVAMAKVTTPIFMGVIYFGVLTPFGVVRRAFGKNALDRSNDAETYWVTRGPEDAERRRLRMERQF